MLDSLRPDVLHIQYQTGAYGMHPAINLLPWHLHRLPRCPLMCVTFHDLLEPYLFPKAGPLRRWITLRLARDADRVIVTNEEDAARLKAVGLAPHTIPIGSNIPVAPPPGYERDAWRVRHDIGPDDTLVAYFGLLSRSKGVDVLLDALEQLADIPMRLLLVGGAATAPQDRAYAAEIAARIAQPFWKGRIIWTGHVDEAAVSAHLLAADIVALPFQRGASFRSGSLLAALTHGAPIITTAAPSATSSKPASYDAHSMPRLVDSNAVMLVPAGDSQTLAAMLRKLATDLELRQCLRKQARVLSACFAWNAIAQQHEEVYRGSSPG
jgi:glycosyltransferase involved in cell wall biosynthesis